MKLLPVQLLQPAFVAQRDFSLIDPPTMKEPIMNLLCRFVGLAVFASATFFLSEQLLAQTVDATATVQATIQFSNGQSVTVTDFSNLIGVQPNDFVNITIQFTPDAIGEPVIVEALDGGPVSTGSSIRVVEADGSLSFAFLAAANPGPKSIGIRGGAGTFRLQFWVLDLANPQNNPPVITAVNQG